MTSGNALADERSRLLPSSGDANPAEKHTKEWYRWHLFICCLACCASAGSITLFSLYSPALQHELGLSQLQINLISIACEAGTYLPTPIVGFLCDKYPPSTMIAGGSLLFSISYYLCHLVVSGVLGDYRVLAACFALIGLATSCVYLACFVTCARLFSHRPGLSIAAPTTSFGLSAFWEAQIVRGFLTDKTTGFVNLPQIMSFFSVFYLIAGTVGVYAAYFYERHFSIKELEEEIEQVDNSVSSVSATGGRDSSWVRNFLLSKIMWTLMFAFVLTTGPLEMYINNMGAVIESINKAENTEVHSTGGEISTSSQVSLFALLSTLARITLGVSSDYIAPYISRPTTLAISMTLTACSHIMLSIGAFNSDTNFGYCSAINGFGYGSVFTLYPTIIASVWGVENVGINWGSFIFAPAVGAMIYGYIFANIYDKNTPVPGDVCKGLACYQKTFQVTSVSIFIASVLVFACYQQVWKKRGIIV